MVLLDDENSPKDLNGEDYEDDSEDDEEDDVDIDAAAEEIARQLLADLTKANASSIMQTPASTSSYSNSAGAVSTGSLCKPAQSLSQKSVAIFHTIKSILVLLQNDPFAQSSFASTPIPNLEGQTVLRVLDALWATKEISREIAKPLSNALLSLAQSSHLFRDLRHSDASWIQLDKGKRKRGEDEDNYQSDSRTIKRTCLVESDLQAQVDEAVHAITHALANSPTQTLDPVVVSTIRLQLHQVFLFAVTSSAAGGQNMHALQEIGGLIQVIGVLSGIQIGQSSDTNPEPYAQSSAYPWPSGQAPVVSTDIGTAVYPCLVPGCKKVFSRLYSLRLHQRLHATHRPFRCTICPASFARNHDLKRHVKLHDGKAWKCGGCHKVFSRRDAIKRHKNGSKTRGSKGEMCLDAEIMEVEVNEEEAEESAREERRAKLWNGIATSQANFSSTLGSSGVHLENYTEDGELRPDVVTGIQTSILGLHGPLQACVGHALGAPTGHTIPMDPAAGQATLASVIARAQLQNMTALNPSTISGMDLPAVGSMIPVGWCEGTRHEGSQPQAHRHSPEATAATSLSIYGLSDEQTKMLEEAIANAAAAAQAQAEAEAALEEEEEEEEEEEDGEEHHGL